MPNIKLTGRLTCQSAAEIATVTELLPRHTRSAGSYSWVVGFAFDHADIGSQSAIGVQVAYEVTDDKEDVRQGRVVVIRDPWTTALDNQWST